MTEAFITNILLSLFTLLFGAIIFGEIFERLGMDAVIGYTFAGLLLGPSVFNLISPESMENFAIIGAILILFLAGLKEEDASALYKNKTAIGLGLGLLIVSFIFLFIVFNTPLTEWIVNEKFTLLQVLFLALTYAVVDLGVPAKILMSKKLLNTDFGQIVLNGAVLNVIAGLSLLTMFTLFFTPEFNYVITKILGIVGFMLLYLILFWAVTRFSKYFMLLETEEAQFTITLVIILLMAYMTELLGFSNILGAFLAGIIISRTAYSSTRDFVEKFKGIAMGLFIPLFFAWFGLELQLFGDEGIIANIFAGLFFFFLACFIKFVYTYTYCKLKKIPAPGLIASSMLSLDVESLIILILAINIGIFTTSEILSIFAPSVLLTTLLVAVLVKIFLRIEEKQIITKK
jgi:Kef-type K+ transport system membrane component KefB